MKPAHIAVAAALLSSSLSAVSGCSGCGALAPTNPYDPATPADHQAPGSLHGRVVLVDGAAADAHQRVLDGVTVGLKSDSGAPLERDGQPVAVPLTDVDTAAGTGAFELDGLTPGNYAVVVDGLAGAYDAPVILPVRLIAGQKLDVGDLVFTLRQVDGGGPGTIDGDVTLADGADAQRKVSLFVLRNGGAVGAGQTFVDAAGHFSFDGLGPGTYAVVAESNDYTPSYRTDLAVGAGSDVKVSLTGDDALVLQPLSGVLRPDVGSGSVFLNDGVFYVSGDDVNVLVLAGVNDPEHLLGITGMRISTSPDFLDGAGAPLPFTPYAVATDVTLPAVEGNIPVFLQLEARSPAGFVFDSPTITGNIIRDVTPPVVSAATLDGIATDDTGTFLAQTNALVVSIDAEDDTSGVDAIAVEEGAAPPDPLPFTDVTAPPGLVRFHQPKNVASDGPTHIFVKLRDKAGNESALTTLDAVVDRTPPDVSLVVANAPGGVLSSRLAQVSFDESGAQNDLPVAMQLRLRGEAFGPLLPFGDGSVVVDTGVDGDTVTIDARLFDRVGNSADVSAGVALHLRGSVVGVVAAEGVPLLTPDAGGAAVTVSRGGAVVGTATSDASGAFAVADLPEGSGYSVAVALDGYRTVTLNGLSVPTPADGVPGVSDVGAVQVPLARGDLRVEVQIDGGAPAPGVDVALALDGGRSFADSSTTDASGAASFSALPATRAGESYRVEARRADDGASAISSTEVVADTLTTLPLSLVAVGDFDLCRPTGACDAVSFLNTTAARLRLRGGISGIDTLLVSVNGGAPAAVPFSVDNQTPIDLGSVADGRVDLTVQPQAGGVDVGGALRGSVIVDRVAPTNATIVRVADATAQDPRFTRQANVKVVADADAGSGDVAPLGAPRLVVAATPPATPPSELAGCVAGAPCAVTLPASEGLFRVQSFSCDKAGNCAAPVSTFVIRDVTPPSSDDGVTFAVSADGAAADPGPPVVTVIPTFSYRGELGLGAAKDGNGVGVVDENSAAVADVFAYRTSLSAATLGSADLRHFSTPPAAGQLRAGADVVMPALDPIATPQTVFVSFVDAAGNVATVPLTQTLRIDHDPPGLLVSVASSSSVVDVPFTVSTPVGAESPVSVDVVVDGGAPVTFAIPLDPSAHVTLPDADGAHDVTFRGKDAVGNAVEVHKVVTLDRAAPRIDVVRCVSAGCVADTGDGVIATRTTAVSLLVTSSSPDLASIDVSVDGATPTTFAAGAAVDVTVPANTGSTITVVGHDAVGNASAPVVRAVLHDDAAPTIASFTLKGGAALTNDPNVPVHVDVPAGDAVGVRYASSNVFTGPVAPFRADDTFVVAGGDGAKQICVEVRDATGNTADTCADITLDRAAPAGTVALATPGVKAATTVSVVLTYPNDTTDVAASKSALACDSASTPYQAATGSGQVLSVSLDPGDGVHPVFACFRDGAGNSAGDQTTVTLDQTPPTASASIAGGAEFATTTAVSLDVTASADVTDFAVAIDTSIDCTTATYVPFAASSARTLPDADGVHTISVCTRDAAGNVSVSAASDTIKLDTTPPSGSVVVNGGATFTKDPLVSVVLTRSPDANRMALAPDSLNCASADYIPFSPTAFVPLGGADGNRSVVLCLKDDAGLVNTSVISDAITLDRAAPTGTIVLNGGAATTPVADVEAALTFDADTDRIAVSTEGCGNPAFIAPTSPVAVTLQNVGGLNTVSLCLVDHAGNVNANPITATIFLEDNAGQDQLVVALESGAATTRSRSVTLTLIRPSTNFTQMKVVEGSTIDCNDLSGYEAFASTKAVTLSAGAAPFEGNRTVSACVRDPNAGTALSAQDAIFVDSFAPSGTVSIDAGAGVTGTATVTAELTNAFAGQNEVVTVALSETSTLSGGQCNGSFEAFSAAKSFTFSGADGTRTLFACFRDAAGNTLETSDDVVLDRAAPAPVSISAPANVTSTNVTTTLSFPSDAVEVAVAEGALDCATTTSYVPATTSRAVSLAAVEGSQTLIGCFRDAAGNVSQATTVTSLDLQDPVGTVTLAGGAAFTTSRSVLATLAVSPDVKNVAFVESAAVPDCSTATGYQAFQASSTLTLSAGDGTKTVQVCLEDNAGRRAPAVADSIVLDQTAPNGALAIDDGDAATRARNVVLSIDTGANLDVVAFAAAETTISCNASNLAYSPFSGQVPFLLSSGDGNKTVKVCLKDAAGNVSSVAASDDIALDSVPPSLPATAVSIQDGDGFLQGEPTVAVQLRWTTAGDAVAAKIAESAVDCQADAGFVALPAAATTTTLAAVPVSSGDGQKLLVACFKDAAGNTVTAQDSTVRDNAAPTGSVLLANGDAFSRGAVTPVTFATSTDVNRVALVVSATPPVCASQTFTSITAVTTVNLGADGQKTVFACFEDAAGNIGSTPASDTIVLDTSAPSATLLIDGAASGTVTSSSTVTLSWAGLPPDVAAVSVSNASIASCAAATYVPFSATTAHVLTGGDGGKTVFACLKDAAGNTSTTQVSATTTLDTVPPSLPAVGAVAVEDGDGFLQSEAAVDVALSWTTIGDVAAFKIGEGAVDCGSEPYVRPASIGTVNSFTVTNVPISSVDGAKTVIACFKDAAGNVSSASDVTVRDQTGPSGSVLVDGGAAFTTGEDVTVSLRMEAGTARFALVETNNASCTTPTVDCAVQTGFVAATGALVDGLLVQDVAANLNGSPASQGGKCFEACFEDGAGNRSAAALDGITLDSARPTLATLTVDDGAARTRERTVAVALGGAAADTASMALAAGDGASPAITDCGAAVYAPFSPSSAVTLPAGDGQKTVSVCLKDAAGNVSAAATSRQIVLDTTPPSLTVALAGGASTTSSAAVTAALSNPGGDAVQMKIVTPDNDSDTESFGPFSASVPVVLEDDASTAADGVKTVVITVRDAAGNETTATASILLDRAAPSSPSVRVNGGDAVTNSVSVSLALAAAGATEMQIAVDGTADTEPFVPFASSAVVTLPGGDCSPVSNQCKHVAVVFRDAAGNATAQVSDAISLDTAPPVGTLSLASSTNSDSAGFATTTSVAASLAYTGGDAVQFKLGEGSADCASPAGYTALDGTTPDTSSITLTGADGTKTVVACFEDAAGNTSFATANIVLDRVKPRGAIVLAGGAASTSTASVTVLLSPESDDLDTARVALVNDTAPTCNASLTYAPVPATHALSAGDGNKTVFACFRDLAGNFSSAPVSDGIVVDTAAPTLVFDVTSGNGPAPGDGGAARFTKTRNVVVGITSLSNDVTELAVVNSNQASSCAAQAFTPFPQPVTLPFSTSFVLADVDGAQDVTVCVRDGAGNTTGANHAVTLDRQAPQAAIALDTAGGFVTSTTVTGTLTVTPSSDPLRAVASTDPAVDCSVQAFSGSFAALSSSISQAVPGGDGAKFVVRCLQDRAGNVSSVSASALLDATLPTVASFAADGGAAVGLDTTVTADFTGASSDVVQMAVATTPIADCAGASYTAFVSSSNVTGLAEGDNTLFACLRDAAGNVSDADPGVAGAQPFTDHILVDTQDPTLSSFAVGAAGGPAPDPTFTSSRNVVVRMLSNAVSADVVALAVQETSINCATASYQVLPQPLPTTLVIPFELAAGSDGARSVAVCVKDAAGRTNGANGLTVSINLDTTPPQISSFTINGDALITRAAGVTVSQSASPSNDVLRFALRPDPSTDCSAIPFSTGFGTLPTTAPATLAPATSGTRFVVGCFQDRAGNVTSVADDIELDNLAPIGVAVACASCNLVEGQEFTSADDADLDVSSTSPDVVAAVTMVSEDDAPPLGENRICAGDGDCRTGVGETCAVFPVGNGAFARRCVQVQPDLEAVSVALATAASPVTTAPATPLEGVQHYFVAAVDAAGNVSDPVEASVIRDVTPPAPTFLLNTGAVTNQQTVFVRNLTVPNELPVAGVQTLGAFQASALSTFADAPVLGYTAAQATDAFPVTLTAGDGAKTVAVRFVDNAGNVGSPIPTRAVTLDTTAPSTPAFAAVASITNSPAASVPALAVQSTDAGGLRAGRPYDLIIPAVLAGANCPASTTLLVGTSGRVCEWDGTTTAGPPLLQGDNTLRVRAVDIAGNASGEDLVTVKRDSTPPVLSSVKIIDTRGFLNTSAAQVIIDAVDNETGLTDMQVATDGFPDTEPFIAFAQTTTVVLTGDGPKAVAVRVRDAAGNVSSIVTANTTLDTTPPLAPSLSVPGSAATGINSECARVNSSSTLSLDTNFAVIQARKNGGAFATCSLVTAEPAAVTPGTCFFDTVTNKLSIDLDQDANNLVEVRAVDKAGNVGESSSILMSEVSSNIIPTDLTAKQVCATGDFMILHDANVWPATLASAADPAGDDVFLLSAPRVALLDLDTLELYPFGGSDGLAATMARAHDINNPEDWSKVIDVGCAIDSNKILFDVWQDNGGGTGRGLLTLIGWPDPLGTFQDTGAGVEFGPIRAGSSSVGANSIDVINWSIPSSATDFSARVLAVDNTFAIFTAPESVRGWSISGTTVTVETTAREFVQNAAFPRAIFGVGVAGSFGAWATFSSGAWHVHQNSAGGTVATLFNFNTSITQSTGIWNVRLHPATFGHLNSDIPSNFVLSDASGVVRRFLSTSTSSFASIGSGAPAHQPFLERGVNQVAWVDDQAPNELVLNNTFSSSVRQPFRFPIDPDRPILATGRTAAGEPVVVFHTSGSGQQGVVIGYSNEATCFNN